MLVWAAALCTSDRAVRITDRADTAVLRQIAGLRRAWLTDVMGAVDRTASGWAVTVVGLSLLGAMVGFRRWRHLFTFLGTVVLLEIVGGDLLYGAARRPRPYGVQQLGRWAGFSLPAAPLAVVAFLVVGIAYALVVPGRLRTGAKVVGAVVVLTCSAAALYLATFHPSDILIGVTLAVAVPLNAFRYFTPNEVVPVSYRRHKTAHLDISGRRGAALRAAVRDQLGLEVLDVQPHGQAGSGGSTPLLITVTGDPELELFGKLYAMSHVRADRWYKLGRLVLYGRLEDEAPYQSVRRLVQYEDYALRVFNDAGLPTASPYGIVEITPEREYLLVTEFLDGAREIGEADVDDGVIDAGLQLIRNLWDAGLAHRDIKPANLLVRDGHVLLIDVAFAQIRPSPWRQAVDLANMMLVLAVRTDAERVYQRALRYFTPDDVAEAFAAARGIASPTQLRMAMKQDGRDLLAQFRALAPPRQPVSLQRWGLRRIVLALALVGGVVVGLQGAVNLVTPAHDLRVHETPTCGTSAVLVLLAQSVPSATSVPCIAALPAGWRLGGVHITNGDGSFWLDSDIAGERAVRATLRPPHGCDVSQASPVPSDEVGMRRYEQPEQLPPRLRTTRTYLFDGGCVTYEFDLELSGRTGGVGPGALLFAADSALAFQPRSLLVDDVRRRTGLALCGAGAECPS
jgi:tRNA A-37 threonylcarbamoyl transferase component Bud32